MMGTQELNGPEPAVGQPIWARSTRSGTGSWSGPSCQASSPAKILILALPNVR